MIEMKGVRGEEEEEEEEVAIRHCFFTSPSLAGWASLRRGNAECQMPFSATSISLIRASYLAATLNNVSLAMREARGFLDARSCIATFQIFQIAIRGSSISLK